MPKPSLTPTQSDLAREHASATKFFGGSVPAVYKGKTRGTTKDIAWRTNVAFWDAYDLEPVKLAPGDTAGANAWLRIEAKGTPILYAAKSKSPAASWDPNAPTWPLPTAPAAWKSGSVFAAKRPFYGPQTRYHTGIDLAAEAGTPVLAPEAGRIVDPNSGWDYDEKTGKGVKSIIMTTVSGFTVLIGGIRPGSSPLKAGQEVVAGQQIAEVGRYKGGDAMAHFSLYKGKLTKSKVLAQKKWELNKSKPPDLLDPAAYLAECAMNPKYVKVGAFGDGGDDPGLVENDVEGGEVSEGEEGEIEVFASGARSSKKPCLDVCGFEDAAAWRAAALLYRKAAETQRSLAQAAVAKGKAPTAEVAAALQDLQVVDQFLAQSLDGMNPVEIVDTLVDACHQCLIAGTALGLFGAGIEKPSPSKGGGGLGMIFGIAAAAVVVTVAVVVISGKRSSRAAVLAIMFLLSVHGCGPQSPEPPIGSSTWATDVETLGSTLSPTSDGTSSGSLGSSSLGSSSSGGSDGCVCESDADCGPVNICDEGRCVFVCDKTCPVTCQMGGLCEAPCDYTCPDVCDGTCLVCPEA